jgi:16S rRNA C967 or C1407 C5-methylase (RsmB/RsmF family)
LEKDDQVLDLCCAPGAKLCMISNILGREGLGTVTGVDLAGHRLATCRSLLKKYKVGEKVRLFEADGTTFSVPPPSRLGNRKISEVEEDRQKRQKIENRPFWASRMLRFDNQVNHTSLYDKVIVDAECTHDGSIAHILKVKILHRYPSVLRKAYSLYNSMKNGAGMHSKRILWTLIE